MPHRFQQPHTHDAKAAIRRRTQEGGDTGCEELPSEEDVTMAVQRSVRFLRNIA